MRKFFAVVLVLFMITGCASVPKPKSVGQTVGSLIDSSIAWSSQGIQKFLNK